MCDKKSSNETTTRRIKKLRKDRERQRMLNVTLSVSSVSELKVLENEKFYYVNGGWLAYSSCSSMFFR